MDRPGALPEAFSLLRERADAFFNLVNDYAARIDQTMSGVAYCILDVMPAVDQLGLVYDEDRTIWFPVLQHGTVWLSQVDHDHYRFSDQHTRTWLDLPEEQYQAWSPFLTVLSLLLALCWTIPEAIDTSLLHHHSSRIKVAGTMADALMIRRSRPALIDAQQGLSLLFPVICQSEHLETIDWDWILRGLRRACDQHDAGVFIDDVRAMMAISVLSGKEQTGGVIKCHSTP